MRRWTPGLSALGVIALAMVVVQQLPWPASYRGDFAPFVMTITAWSSARMGGFSDGRPDVPGTATYRLDYSSRENWTFTLVSDEIGGNPSPQTFDAYACQRGLYGHLDASGRLHLSSNPTPCAGPGRWLSFGLATGLPWQKSVTDGVVTYVNTGERVSFDLKTGLPLEYEALGADGVAQRRTTYHVEQR